MADKRTDYEKYTDPYSTIPAIRKKQEEEYLKVLNKKLNKPEYYSEDDIQDIYKQVYLHQLLEHDSPRTSEIKEIFEGSNAMRMRRMRFSELKTPEEYAGFNVGKYSILPWVKAKQHKNNKKLLEEIEKYNTMAPRDVFLAYSRELNSAKNEGRAPNRIVLTKIEKKASEFRDDYWRSRFDWRYENSKMDEEYYKAFHYSPTKTYSRNRAKREAEIEEELDVMRFYENHGELIVGKDNVYSTDIKVVEEYLDTYRRNDDGTNGSRRNRRGGRFHTMLVETKKDLEQKHEETQKRYEFREKMQEERRQAKIREEEEKKKRDEEYLQKLHDEYYAKVDERIERGLDGF